jgi:hypothetical protein
MSGALRHPWRAAVSALLLLATVSAGAAAQTVTTGEKPPPLRGYQVPDKPVPAKPARAATLALPAPPTVDPGNGPARAADLSPIPRFQDDPAPRFNLDPAPRVAGLSPPGSGAECRTACAISRYQCSANEPVDVCDGVWSQCVAGCAESSSSPL